MSNNRKVFIVNDGAKDYSAAETFGEIVFCTDAQFKRTDIASMNRQLSETLLDAREDDLLMVAGLPQLMSVASAILAAQFGRVNFLIYDGSRYVERELVL